MQRYERVVVCVCVCASKAARLRGLDAMRCDAMLAAHSTQTPRDRLLAPSVPGPATSRSIVIKHLLSKMDWRSLERKRNVSNSSIHLL